jgi:hypothetical protein
MKKKFTGPAWFLHLQNSLGSWAHCFGIVAAYLLPVVLFIPSILHYRVSVGQTLGGDRHPSESPNPENLLDDVLS